MLLRGNLNKKLTWGTQTMFTARHICLLLVGLVSAIEPVIAQFPRTNIYSRPELPPADVLRRLDLHLAWSTVVPMDGKHDRILYVLIDGKDLLVLTNSGQVARVNAESGQVLWKSRPGRAYTAVPYLTANHRSVYVILNATLYSLDRERGLVKWEYSLPGGLSTAPVVDGEQIYAPRSDTRLTAFTLPFVMLMKDGTPGQSLIYSNLDSTAGRAERPQPKWNVITNLDLAYQPVQSTDSLFVVTPDGKGRAFRKFPTNSDPESFRYEINGKISVPPSGYGSMAYFGSDDSNLYALDIDNGRLSWRYTAGSPISRRPVALESDVYVTSEREGLARLNRSTGDPMWRIPIGGGLYGANPTADRFLAASDRFVYALDGVGRLIVIDRRRGVTRGWMEKTDLRVPIVNQVSDRIYLAANDGTIVCMHDRELLKPLRHRKKLEDAASAILKLLDTSVVEKAGAPGTLDSVLAGLRTRYGVSFIYGSELLREAGLSDIATKEVSIRAVENKPLRTVYQSLLKQVNAGYLVEDNTLLIVPLDKADMKGPMDGKGPKDDKKDDTKPKDDKEPKDDKKDDKEAKDDKKPKDD